MTTAKASKLTKSRVDSAQASASKVKRAIPFFVAALAEFLCSL